MRGNGTLRSDMPAVRLARPDDAAGLLDIYAPIVRDTAISFELEPPTVADFRGRIERTLAHAPWLVLDDGGLQGYAYATRFRDRPAYQWTVETTVYVRDSARRRGVGRALMAALLRCLELQGFATALAVIALPNDASVRLHERLGFRSIGVFHRVGFKFGRWHDTGWWERPLREDAGAPPPPRPIEALLGTPAWDRAISSTRLE